VDEDNGGSLVSPLQVSRIGAPDLDKTVAKGRKVSHVPQTHGDHSLISPWQRKGEISVFRRGFVQMEPQESPALDAKQGGPAEAALVFCPFCNEDNVC
jgi:hypothetical protein